MEEGRTGADIARELGVKPPAVSKAIRRLSLAKCSVVLRSAEEIKRRTLRAEDRILRVDQITHDTLEQITGRVRRASVKEREPLEAHQLRYLEECRKQLSCWADIRQKLLLENEVRLLKKIVIETISKVDQGVADEIFRRFDEQNALESIFR